MEKTNSLTSENKMGTMPVVPLIFNMSLPIMFGMLIMGIIITDKNFAKITERKQQLLGKNKK